MLSSKSIVWQSGCIRLRACPVPASMQRNQPSTIQNLAHPFQRALSDSLSTRVWSVIQFISHVLPPSSENDCSKWAEFGVI